MQSRFSPLLGENANFPNKFIKKKHTRWLNDKTIFELGYPKISWFVNVSQINYLRQPNNWSARHWQNNNILLNLVQ